MKYFYGVVLDFIFIKGVYLKERKYFDDNGEFRCKRVFWVFIVKGIRVFVFGVEILWIVEFIINI